MVFGARPRCGVAEVLICASLPTVRVIANICIWMGLLLGLVCSVVTAIVMVVSCYIGFELICDD